MATQAGESELRRRLSAVISLVLIASSIAVAGDIDPSRYSVFGGDKFYLLSETTFSSEENAQVRLEVAGNKDVLEPYSGVDVRVYRIPRPLDFLKKQKSLHRPVLAGNYSGEGLSNALNYLWDSWYKKSRLAWQRVFSSFTRKAVVEQAPELKQASPHSYRSKFDNNAQFKPISGLEVVDQFRYPVWQAKRMAAPAGVSLSGSSSNFLEIKQGNVYIPVGKRKPGLYLVEAMIGTFRAVCFLFVSDTVAITKLSSHQELVWSVDKKTGKPSGKTRLLFTDGVGVLGEGKSGKDGVYSLEGKSLERSYVLGEDSRGGVFVSENFYYDSEIYGTKIFVFTDRPLYRPGDEVHVKLLGREFRTSSGSVPIAPSTVTVTVTDPAGTPVTVRRMEIAAGLDGGNLNFKLPEFALAGGYGLQVKYKGAIYASAFRVARYVKPHYEVDIDFGREEYKLNEAIKGTVKLTYAGTEPVEGAQVEVEVRKQKLTIVEGELQYLDRFPVQVSKNQYTSTTGGTVEFEIPPAVEPTRYVVSVRSIDSASYRVTSTRELLVQASSTPMLVISERNFSAPGEKVTFKIKPSRSGPQGTARKLASWEAIRLQDQSKTTGELRGASDFLVSFDRPGSYSVVVKDQDGITVATASHWVQGPELAQTPGSLSIVLDRNEYEPGDRAVALLTFSEDVAEALVTLERDRVEAHSLLSAPSNWIRLKKLSAREYEGEIPISRNFSPNITLSVVYVVNGHYFFENKGIKVTTPRVQIAFRPDKETYRPGERVTVSVETTFKERPIPASLSVGVVDEMIYALQPEIAPNISDFFFHPRRNQVRTSSSLSFHSFDAASSATGATPSAPNQYSERSLKLRERPRREEKDTAFWEPTLKTDASGKATFSFVMPDSLTRWRITGRAIASNGYVGQRVDFIDSQKEVYLKWAGPTHFRKGDQVRTSAAIFNMTDRKRDVGFVASGPGVKVEQNLTLRPGANYVPVSLTAERDGDVTLTIRDGGTTLDQLAVRTTATPVAWLGTYNRKVSANSLDVPRDAFNIRLRSANGDAEAFLRALDELVDYPYGCVEQTSSRLLPLALVFPSLQQLGASEQVRERVQNRLINERLRLVRMAGPNAVFSWWGDQTQGSAFMTAYAYYADWVASRALGIRLPQDHWEHVLDAYEKYGEQEPLINKAVILWTASEMGLPIKTLVQGVFETALQDAPMVRNAMFEADPIGENAGTYLLLDVVGRKAGVALPANLAVRVAEARRKAPTSGSSLALSALLLSKTGGAQSAAVRAAAERVLNQLAAGTPTIERGLSLAFIHRALGAALKASPSVRKLEPGPGWVKTQSRLGGAVWQYRGSAPLERLPESVTRAGSVRLLYDSFKPETQALAVEITRKLEKLVRKEKPLEFEVAPISGDWSADMRELYLDEITIAPTKPGEVFQFGMVEAALPPGAEIEQSTWGMTVHGPDGKPIQIGAAGFEQGEGSYSAPIEKLSGPVTIYHLVRFSQPGTFSVPPTRFFRMYSPAEKAFEGGNASANRKIVVR